MGKLRTAAAVFVDEIAGALEAAGLGKRKRPRFAIVQEDGRFRCYRVGRDAPVLLAEGDLDCFEDAVLPRQVRAKAVELRLDSGAIVIKTLQLPEASRGYADAIVRHQIERLTPWTAENAAYDYSESHAEDGGFELRIVAAARDRVEATVARLAQAGVQAGIIGVSGDPMEIPSPVDLLHRGRVATRARLRKAAAVGLSFLLLAAGGASLSSAAVLWRLSGEAGRLQAELDSARAKVQALAGSSQDSTPPGLLAMRKAARPMVLVLEDLSAAIPPDTHLTGLSIEDREVSIGGLSREAPALIGILEGTRLLDEVGFAATTTRDPVSWLDRFEIKARIAFPTEEGGQ